MASRELLPEAKCAVRAGRAGLGCEIGCRKGNIGTGLLRRNIEAAALAQGKSISKLWIAGVDQRVRTFKVQGVRRCVRVHEVCESLADQEIVGLPICVTQTRRGR